MKPGLYNENNELIYSWEDLINAEIIITNRNKLTFANSDYMCGKLIISSKITEINSEVFTSCENLTNIILHNNIKKINNFAFSHCKKLKEIILPDSLEEINAFLFGGCESLEKVKLSKNIKKINSFVFYNCKNLETIIYPGTEVEFKEIEGWKNIFTSNNLDIKNIIFHKTLEELIDEGKNLREANNILKEQEEQSI